MNTPPKQETKTEATTGHADNFDIDKAMKVVGFSEFLAKFPDYGTFNMEDQAFVAQKFETFRVKVRVEQELKRIYTKQIEEEMGVKLSDEDLDCVKADIEKKALEDFPALLALAQQIDGFNNLPKKIKELSEQFASLGNVKDQKETLSLKREVQDKVELARDMQTFFGKARTYTEYYANALPTMFMSYFTGKPDKENITRAAEEKMRIEANQELTALYGRMNEANLEYISTSVGKDIKEIESTLKKIEEVEQLRAQAEVQYSGMKTVIQESISNYAGLQMIVQTKIKNQFLEMTKGKTLEAVEKGQDFVSKLRGVNITTKTGINTFQAFEDKGITDDVLEKQLNDGIIQYSAEKIREAIKTTKMEKNPLENMEKTLDVWLKKQRIGSKEGDEAKEFVRSTIEDARNRLSDSPEDRVKKIVLARILIKLKKK